MSSSKCTECGSDDLELDGSEWHCNECEHVFENAESIEFYRFYVVDFADND